MSEQQAYVKSLEDQVATLTATVARLEGEAEMHRARTYIRWLESLPMKQGRAA